MPPRRFIAMLVEFPMMSPAEWNSEIVAWFEPKSTGLREAQVMGVSWSRAANEAGLRSDEAEVLFIAHPLGLGKSKGAFIDTD